MTARLHLFALPLIVLLQGSQGESRGEADEALARALLQASRDPGTTRVATPEVDAEREANLRAFENVYQRQREALFARHAGAWVAIAGGELLPRGDKDRVLPAATLEEVLSVAEAVAPGARHRFVYRIGEEGDVRYRPTINSHPEWIGRGFFPHMSGALWITPEGVYLAPSGAQHDEGVRIGAGELEECGPRAMLAVSTGPGTPARELSFVVSTGFEGHAILGREAAAALELARFEIPGALHLDYGSRTLRRARARFHLDGGLLDDWLPVGVRVQ